MPQLYLKWQEMKQLDNYKEQGTELSAPIQIVSIGTKYTSNQRDCLLR